MAPTPFIVKAIGTVVSGETCRQWGGKLFVYVFEILTVIGVLLQTASRSAAQFTVGEDY